MARHRGLLREAVSAYAESELHGGRDVTNNNKDFINNNNNNMADTVGVGPVETTECMPFRGGQSVLLPQRFQKAGKVSKFVFHVAKGNIIKLQIWRQEEGGYSLIHSTGEVDTEDFVRNQQTVHISEDWSVLEGDIPGIQVLEGNIAIGQVPADHDKEYVCRDNVTGDFTVKLLPCDFALEVHY